MHENISYTMHRNIVNTRAILSPPLPPPQLVTLLYTDTNGWTK